MIRTLLEKLSVNSIFVVVGRKQFLSLKSKEVCQGGPLVVATWTHLKSVDEGIFHINFKICTWGITPGTQDCI